MESDNVSNQLLYCFHDWLILSDPNEVCFRDTLNKNKWDRFSKSFVGVHFKDSSFFVEIDIVNS